MSDASLTGSTKTLGNKHRLPLFKQIGSRLKSDDQLENSQINILTAVTEHSNDININNNNNNDSLNNLNKSEKVEQRKSENSVLTSGKRTKQVLMNEQPQNDEQNKMNISREDLIRLLSLLRSELQSKEIALAAIKCEQLKRLINPIEISRSSLANAYIELQDRLKILDQSKNLPKTSSAPPSSSASSAENSNEPKKSVRDVGVDEDNDVERESLNILNTLLELLDRHPLLALPRDSVYCLDYNCNELSSKNYLNLKIQHLDNLINQHRKFRYYMNERLKRSEQRYLNLNREYELDKNLRNENEKLMYKVSGKAILLKHIAQLKETIEKEKKEKQAIVINLLNELLDERERSESLAKKLAEKESNSSNMFTKDRIAEIEKILKLETEQSNLSLQLKKQAAIFSKERNELQSRISKLENENSSLKDKLKQQEKLIKI